MKEELKNKTNAELISIIMRCTQAQAAELLAYYDNDILTLANHLSYPNIQGVTTRMTNNLLAAVEFGIRIEKAKKNLDRVKVSSSEEAFEIFKEDMSALDHEELWALYMSKGGKVIIKKRISMGSVDATCADLRIIALPAIECNASYVVLCHNHPHSNIKPSMPDRELTKKVKEALALFDVRLMDHLIISDGKYYSFADNGDI